MAEQFLAVEIGDDEQLIAVGTARLMPDKTVVLNFNPFGTADDKFPAEHIEQLIEVLRETADLLELIEETENLELGR